MGDTISKASEYDEEILGISLVEMNEHLDNMETDVLAMEEGGESSDPERVNRIFRAAHTIKGTAGFLGMARVQRLSHALENLLARIRDGAMRPDPQACDLLLQGIGRLRSLLDANSPVDDPGVEALAAAVAGLLGGTAMAPASSAGTAADPAPSSGTAPEPFPATGTAQDLVPPAEQADGGKPSWTPATPAPTTNSTPAPTPTPAPSPAPSQAHAKADPGHVRVNVSQLDKLMALAGELVLTRNALVQSVASGSKDAISGTAQRIDALTSELQDGIMLTRMQPIGSAFGRFRRVVRDLARQLEKRIDLSIGGEEVEVDKTVIEAIGDPLVHLVRNACDHGIETPAARAAAGKPETGHLRLGACHAAGQVWIEIEDDGAGIDPARIKAKALEKGLLGPAELAAMGDKEALMLVFAPGFSTAAKVTDVSGRGVGLDVVQSGLARIGGAVEIESRPGAGTRFRIRLPLTLAIIPSLLVKSGEERFALPQANILELARIPSRETQDRLPRVGNAESIRLRGEVLPLVRLDEALGIRAGTGLQEPPPVTDGAGHVAIVAAGDLKYGLLVDAFLDSMEIVVKPFGKHLAKCMRYAGATILGDGQVALILDVLGISKAMGIDQAAPASDGNGTAMPSAGPLRRDYLVFGDGEEGFALPLERVARIERIPVGGIAAVGARRAYVRAGSSLALLALRDGAAEARLPDGHAYAVAFLHGGREYGLLVSEIRDIVQSDAEMDAERYAQPGFAGAVQIGGKLVLVPDLDFLAGRSTAAEWEQEHGQ